MTTWREHLAGWPLPPAPFQLDPTRTALIAATFGRVDESAQVIGELASALAAAGQPVQAGVCVTVA